MKNGWPWALDSNEIASHPLVWVGLSGGMDSVVLLHALSNLDAFKSKLRAIHVNHGLSPNAHQWQKFCQSECEKLRIPLVIEALNLKTQSNLEALAREKRYACFLKHIQSGEALVLAHHLDDQMETFFLNAIRGAGLTGLAAIPNQRLWHGISIYRPLLAVARSQLQAYADNHQLSWVEDESNTDTSYSRNFLRHEVLPLLSRQWPNYRQSLAHTIASCQSTLVDLKQRALKDVPALREASNFLCIKSLGQYSEAEIFMAVRIWLEQLQVTMPPQTILHELLTQVFYRKRCDTQPQLRWDQWQLRCYQDKLYVLPSQLVENPACLWHDFPKPLALPSGGYIIAKPAAQGISVAVGTNISVTYRKGGEVLLYRGHHRQLKKLMQEWQIPSFQRQHIPLLYVNGHLQAVVGYAYADEQKDTQRYEINWVNALDTL